MTLRPLRAAMLALLALGLAPAGALAASHDRDTFIREQDENGDGKVSKDEFAETREKEFARQDANHDGGISHDEYVADFKARLEARLASLPADQRDTQRERELKQVEVRFGILDSDKSGKITRAEYAYSGWRMFVRHDTDNDGFVSAADPVAKDPD
jgi:Ca2+-binding EF-hand superfamily protein